MADKKYYKISKSTLVDIADAIRERLGTTDDIQVSNMASLIMTITNGSVTPTPTTKTLTSISATKTTITYAIGDTLDTSDITVVATYSDSTTQNVTSFTVDASSVDMDVEDDYTITVSYTEGGVTKTDSIEISVTDSTIPEGTWQLKTTTPYKYFIIGTDDGTNSDAKVYRAIRDAGLKLTCNAIASNLSKYQYSDNIAELNDCTAPSLVSSNITNAQFYELVKDNDDFELSLHGNEEDFLIEPSAMTDESWTTVYNLYTDGGGTKTLDEFKVEFEKVAHESGRIKSEGGQCIKDNMLALSNVYGKTITTAGCWGGAPKITIDGVTISNMDVAKGVNLFSSDYFRSIGMKSTGAILRTFGTSAINRTDYIHHLQRDANGISAFIENYNAMGVGDCVELFSHYITDEQLATFRNNLAIIKQYQDEGKIKVVHRNEYADLGEYVSNPITSINVSRDSITLGDTDSISDYNITVTYADGTTSTPQSDVIVDNSSVNTSQVGIYNVSVYYRGFSKTISVGVVGNINLPDTIKNATDGYYTILTMSDNADHLYCVYFSESTGTPNKSVQYSTGYYWNGLKAGKVSTYESTDGGTTWNVLKEDVQHYATVTTYGGSYFGTSPITTPSTYIENDWTHIGA